MDHQDSTSRTSEHHSGNMRGRTWALVRDGQVLCSGSEPSAEFMPATSSNSEEHFRRMAEQLGAQLYIGAPAAVETDAHKRIFGMTWDELLERQQRGRTAGRIQGRMPADAVLAYSGGERGELQQG